jgi:hypothetical protein
MCISINNTISVIVLLLCYLSFLLVIPVLSLFVSSSISFTTKGNNMFGFLRNNTSTSRGQPASNSSRQHQSKDNSLDGSLSGGAISPEALLANLNIDLSTDVNIDEQDEDETGLDDPELLVSIYIYKQWICMFMKCQLGAISDTFSCF